MTPEEIAAADDLAERGVVTTEGPLLPATREWLAGQYRAAQALLDQDGPLGRPVHSVTVRIVAREAPGPLSAAFSELDLLLAVLSTLGEVFPADDAPVVPLVYRVREAPQARLAELMAGVTAEAAADLYGDEVGAILLELAR